MAAGVSAGQESGWDAEHDVELLLAFLNTTDISHGTDVLDTEARWRAWVAGRSLGVAGNPGKARVVRNSLRASVGDPREERNARELAGTIRIELTDGVPMLAAKDALGAVLASAARLAMLGYWARFKICAAEDCRSAFFDRSRNRSRTWCSMQVCGNREKARNWRERARA
ncbi:CGNR zinc finger domain-containing protein [Solihabitans fulvus]|uniref:CGNR zinc finger domain-containing protein n=1 Tax=Solihabitans fulvus TaxID=1892852 RepID=A0A5B2XNN4_9PSEU|nr:CGNR zinc finger domain-containing protein [Solihabitans fulvus]